jgi:fibronectin type 3 domain-containing protein
MPPADSDVAGYRVYRSERGATTKNLLDAGLIKTSSYRDLTAVAGSKYIYGVTAVDMHGNESKEALVEVDMP